MLFDCRVVRDSLRVKTASIFVSKFSIAEQSTSINVSEAQSGESPPQRIIDHNQHFRLWFSKQLRAKQASILLTFTISPDSFLSRSGLRLSPVHHIHSPKHALLLFPLTIPRWQLHAHSTNACHLPLPPRFSHHQQHQRHRRCNTSSVVLTPRYWSWRRCTHVYTG